MLTLRDTFTLAWTKLRSRKLWTSLFLVLEILLFAAVLVFTAGVRGFTESLEAFNSQGLNGKYLVTAANVRSNPDLETDPDVMDLAEQLYQAALTEHQALAEQLGLPYSPDSEIAPTEYIVGQRALVVYSPYAQQAINQRMSDYLLADQTDLEAALQGYDYTAIYLQQQLNADGSVVNLQNGQEDLSRYSSSSGNQPVQTFSGLYVLDDDLYADYLFTDLELDPDAIPVVLSVSDAEALLGLGSLSANASSTEKLQHFTELRTAAAGQIVEACYRNSASQEQIYTALQILDQIDRYQDEPGFTPPSLIYALPTTPCGPVTIQSDTRTAAELEQADRQRAYQTALGTYTAPAQQLLRFQIVGLIPTDAQSASANDLLGTIQSLGGVSIVTPLISTSYYDAHAADLAAVYTEPDLSLSYLGLDRQYLIEFPSADAARRFIDEQSCQPRGDLSQGCATPDHLFLLTSDNNHSLVISDLSQTFTTAIIIAVAAVLIITVVLVALTVVRSIASDRKEIAIFRAIGFRRSHILQVYLAYALLLTAIIIVGALLVAFLLGGLLDPWLSSWLTDFLRATFLTTAPLSAQLFAPDPLLCLLLCAPMLLVPLIVTLPAIVLKTRESIISGLKYE